MIIDGKLTRTLLLSVLTAALTACINDKSGDDCRELAPETSHGTGSMSLSLRIGIESVDGSRGLSRANTDDPYTGPYDSDDRYATGTTYENTINRLTLFVQDMGEDGNTPGAINFYNIGTEYPFLPFLSDSENRYLYLTRQQLENVSFGKKRIYAAANLSDAQIEAFVNGGGADAVYGLPGRELTIGNDLASDNGMAMFCTQPAEHQYDIDNTEYKCTFHLRRIAAKVLVTAVTDETGVFAVTGADGDDSPAFKVKMASVSYVVNSLNTSTYLFQHISGNTAIDPNYEPAPADNFIYNPIYSWVNYSNFFQPVLRYDEKRVPGGGNTAANVYSEGIYCPENTFPTQSDFLTKDDREQQITHVIIRARLIPLRLGILQQLVDFIEGDYRGDNTTLIQRLKDAKNSSADGELFFFQCKNQDESELIRGYSLLYENYTGLTNKAYFCDTEGNFYTYGAAKYKEFGAEYKRGENNTTKFKDMEIHAQGYAYYWTYLGNTGSGKIDKDGEDTWKDSQVYRNTYYILHIDRFLKPGNGVDPNKKYIEVHTEVIPFRQSWKGSVSIGDDTPSAESNKI